MHSVKRFLKTKKEQLCTKEIMERNSVLKDACELRLQKAVVNVLIETKIGDFPSD